MTETLSRLQVLLVFLPLAIMVAGFSTFAYYGWLLTSINLSDPNIVLADRYFDYSYEGAWIGIAGMVGELFSALYVMFLDAFRGGGTAPK